MDRESLVRSRRAFIRASGAWVAAASLPAFGAASGTSEVLAEQADADDLTDSALVCVYLMVADSGAELSSGQHLNPALAEVQNLYSAGVAAIVRNVDAPAGWGPAPDSRYSSWRFLPGAAVTPRWASPETAAATRLPSGLTVASVSAADAGALASAASAASFRTVFPETAAGRQLRDAAAVLRLGKSFGLVRPVFTSVTSGFQPGQQAANDRVLADVSSAVNAFYQATVEQDMAQKVTVFTDMDFGSVAAEGRAQLVIGGAVRGGRFYGAGSRRTSYEEYTATLRRWQGGTAAVAAASGNTAGAPLNFLK
jgi:uncharacterized protein (DUF1501 family)